jgi:biopolymer transport protein ExbB
MKMFGSFLAFMNSGGAINWLIFCLYLFSLALFSARAVYFFRSRCRKAVLLAALRDGGFASLEAQIKNREKHSHLYRIAEIFAHNAIKPEAAQSEASLQEAVDREAALLKSEMESGLAFLSFAASVAPLLGLLGTITGLMAAFSQIELRGAAVDISFLSGGIKEAMSTTATGLVTAIFALGCCKLFEYVSVSRLEAMSLAVSFLTEKERKTA